MSLFELSSTKPSNNGAEILLVFGGALIIVSIVVQALGDNPLAFQSAVWIINMVMVGLIWMGLKRRGQDWGNLGLNFKLPSGKEAFRIWLKSILVSIIAVIAFGLGAVVMAIIFGRPEQADLSGYNYLSGNIWLLIGALLAVWTGASFAEEVIYRAFLINRIEGLGWGGKKAKWLAVVISSAVFGLVHFAWGPAGMVQAGFMGLVLGISYMVLKRNLWIVILAHGYMDTVLIVQLYLNPVGN